MFDDLKEGYKAYREGYETRREAYEARAQTDREFWANLPEEDKRHLKLFGVGAWAVFMLIVQLEILANPGVI